MHGRSISRLYRQIGKSSAFKLEALVVRLQFFLRQAALSSLIAMQCIPDDFQYSLQGEQYVSEDEMVCVLSVAAIC